LIGTVDTSASSCSAPDCGKDAQIFSNPRSTAPGMRPDSRLSQLLGRYRTRYGQDPVLHRFARLLMRSRSSPRW